MRLAVLVLLLLTGCSTTLAAEQSPKDPFHILREAYVERDAEKAVSAYSSDAELTYRYGSEVENYSGAQEIAASFEELFSRVDADLKLDLNFRIGSSKPTKLGLQQNGIYRLRFGNKDTSYGTFDVLITPDGDNKFLRDFSTTASRDDFEMLSGPVMLDSDKENLDPQFYGKLTGRFALDENCFVVVTQSFVRLFARNTCTNRWQGLTRKSGLVWTGGDKVISDAQVTKFLFIPDDVEDPKVSTIEVIEGDKKTVAKRTDGSKRSAVTFPSNDGVSLYGNLYTPIGTASGKATVFVHGSGPQDRNGYASIIAATAEELASRGNTVLTFDKRGVGQSSGDWSKMGFVQLAQDAKAAINWLRKQPGVGSDVGLAGSSQAGWVIAKAIEQGARPHHVHLLGAAGAALTVEEQNIYNTKVRMQCAGVPESKIEQALEQQRAFFEYVRTRENPASLDSLTESASVDPVVRDWLFPNSAAIDFEAGNWFTTLEIDFDPLPIWRSYPGKAIFVFSEYDDSTPTSLAIRRLEEISASAAGEIEIHNLSKTQHIGLEASAICNSGLSDSSAFNSELFSTLGGVSSDR